jgi:hypothetical protein
MWHDAAHENNGYPRLLNPVFAERLVKGLAEKSIPVRQRAQLLHDMIKDTSFFKTRMLQERLPGLMADAELMAVLKSRYKIGLTTSQ